MSKYDELKALAEMVISLERADGIPATVWKDAYEEYLAAAGPGTALNLIAEVERLTAENEALRTDAERYRFARHNDNDCFMLNALQRVSGDELDEAIDAAMREYSK